MAKTIRVNVTNKDSIDKAVRQLKDYANKLREAEREVTRQLAEIGVNVIKVEYYNVEPSDYDVFSQETPNGHVIIAYGEDVMFIEFGAGVVTADYEHPNAEGLPPIVAGEWSKTEGSKQFYLKGYWYYNHERYTHYPDYPAWGFHEAKKQIIEQAEEVVRKVFSKYDRY